MSLISEGGYMQQSGRARDDIPLVYDIGRLDPNGGVLAHLTSPEKGVNRWSKRFPKKSMNR